MKEKLKLQTRVTYLSTPYKPYQPTSPSKEIYKNETVLTFEDKDCLKSLSEIVRMVPEGISLDNIFLKIESSNIYDDDGSHPIMSVVYNGLIPNLNYEKELAYYQQQEKRYQKELAKYKKDMAKYKEAVKKQKELNKLAIKLNKLNSKQIETLINESK